MNWKDTVMKLEQREVFRLKCHKAVADYLGKDIPDIKLSDMDAKAIQICRDVALEELEAQAEITWDKTVREVVDIIDADLQQEHHFLYKDALRNIKEQLKKREVKDAIT